jgi:hypothetical protein
MEPDRAGPPQIVRAESTDMSMRTSSASVFSRSESALTNVSDVPSVQQPLENGFIRVSAGLYLHESRPGLAVSRTCLPG